MANTSALFGLKPIKYLNGTPWNGKANVYYVSASDTAPIYKGDALKMEATAAYYESTGKYPTVERASGTSDVIVGVAVGFSTVPEISADPTNLLRAYRPTSTAMYVWVVDDPNVIFEIQESEVTADIATPIAYSDLYANGALVFGSGTAGSTANGNTATGTSYMCLDSTDVHTGAGSAQAGQIKVLRLADRPGNALGAYAVWEVLINLHMFGSGSTGCNRS